MITATLLIAAAIIGTALIVSALLRRDGQRALSEALIQSARTEQETWTARLDANATGDRWVD